MVERIRVTFAASAVTDLGVTCRGIGGTAKEGVGLRD